MTPRFVLEFFELGYLIKHCSKDKHHRVRVASLEENRSEDGYTKLVPILILETLTEYPIPLRLSGWMRVSFCEGRRYANREAPPTILTATQLYYFCRDKDLLAQVRLIPILAIHLVPLWVPL
jgi:hypothetical protein